MNNEIINKINTMFEVDQNARFNAENKYFVYLIDSAHEIKLKEIISRIGYPNKELLGGDGLEKFWLLVQHIEHDTEFQEKCLNNCDFNPREYMHLYDRIQINRGLDQKYGTQFKKINNLEKTNENRIKDGWVSVEDYIKDFNSKEDKKLELKINNDGSAEYVV